MKNLRNDENERIEKLCRNEKEYRARLQHIDSLVKFERESPFAWKDS